MEHLEAIEPGEREPHPLPPETVTRILQAIPASNLRHRTLFTLLYETGIRVGEALHLLLSVGTFSLRSQYHMQCKILV